MQLFSKSTAITASPARSMAFAALMGATMLATPFYARAAAPDAAVPQSPAAAAATGMGGASAATKSETVEQRISSLHAALKITPDEEKKWESVAQAMRDNAAAMDKRIADSHSNAPQNMTAVDDLKQYQTFAQAHVDGLKNLISSFSGLYSMMPDSQKKVADEVFQSSRRQNTASN
jgi:periplasmic protein CpxP/Spy